MLRQHIIAAVVEGIGGRKDAAGIVNDKGNLALDAIGSTQFGHERDFARLDVAVPTVREEQVIVTAHFVANVAITIGKAQGDQRGIGLGASGQGVLGHADIFNGRDDRVLWRRHAAKSEHQQEQSAGKKK